jgi:hypothetical protein
MNVKVVLILSLGLSACGGSGKTDFTGSTTNPIVDSGGTPWPTSTPNADGSNAAPATTIHNTKYCTVDDQGTITSVDSISVQDGDILNGIGGFCISRPIREVWAMVLNYSIVKSVEIDKFIETALPDQLDPTKGLLFAYDINNTVHKMGGMVTIQWVARWFHTLTSGTYQSPNQVAINFQKVDGSNYISVDREGYVLDRVTPTVTSFVIQQTIKSAQVDAARVKMNIAEVIDKLRSATVDWSYLPDKLEN